jgi:hypothetical protein
MFFRSVKFKILVALILTVSTVSVSALYVPTKRETSEPPEEVVYDYDFDDPLEYELLTSVGDLDYYYRESRGTVAIYDNRNDYLWKTGLDLEFSKDIDDECDDMIDLYEEQFLDLDVSMFGNFQSLVNATLTSASIEGNNSQVKINTSGVDATYLLDDIALTYTGVELVNGTSYQVSFDAYTLQNRSIVVTLGELDETVTLTNEMTTYTYTFTVSEATTLEGILSLQFGYIENEDNLETTIYLDNVLVEEFDGANVVAETNQIERGDFELLTEEITTTTEDVLGACRVQEERLNTTYTGFANSLLTIEYYDSANNIKRISSSSYEDVSMEYYQGNDRTHWVFEIDFEEQDIFVVLHMYLDESGIRYEVRDEDLAGDGVKYLAAIIISPFLGASGGAYVEFDINEMDYSDQEIFKYKIPGYSLVPDGSGTLIRFNDNSVKLNYYSSAMYGFDPGQANHYYQEVDSYVPFKPATMPVFGIAHGNSQAAFVAYATEGDEYMQVISMPEENLTYYNFTYPRFEYNKLYFQVYNKSGWGYLSLYEERNHFDINIRYDFLANDGDTGYSADYVGMAQTYREYLIEQGLLHEVTYDYNQIPLRLDFLMSDVEKGVTGYVNMVTTDTDGVDSILSDIMDNGITNINSGLLGWADGGITLGDPRDTDFTSQIGRKGEFEDLIYKYSELGVDISLAQDYYYINEEMMTLRNNATRNVSTWYTRVATFSDIIEEFYFARPVKSVEWMVEQTQDFDKIQVGSYTISGITNNLSSDYSDDTSRTDAKEIVMNGFGELNSDVLVNAYQPNMYVWQYTDRYLETPIYGTQFLIETDTVPFLQLVLQGTMELYGPYSNFSFYTDSDVLRMIDYNIYPNFVLTDQPAYLLSDTLSNNYYSTEYALYEELIVDVYGEVNTALSNVINASWVDRTVVENGVILNEYDNGVSIVINYTDEAYSYEGEVIEPVSYIVIGGNN